MGLYPVESGGSLSMAWHAPAIDLQRGGLFMPLRRGEAVLGWSSGLFRQDRSKRISVVKSGGGGSFPPSLSLQIE
jgi:hypothetical protein